jgi:hypothetical protein
MSDGTCKSNIISFRLSDDDYESVQQESGRQGFASVSTFARFATVTFNAPKQVHSQFDADVNRLWRRLDALTTALERLAGQAGAILTPFNVD